MKIHNFLGFTKFIFHVFNLLSILSPYIFLPLLEPGVPVCYNVNEVSNRSGTLFGDVKYLKECSDPRYLDAVERSTCYPEKPINLLAA